MSELALRSIVVGVDDHERSRDGLTFGAALAHTLGARLIVGAALDYRSLPLAGTHHDEERQAHFDGIFDAVGAQLADVRFDRFELEGDGVHALHDLAERESADLLVIGSTHRGILGRVYPGTVADRLLENAPCAVAVAPQGYAHREHAGFGWVGVAYDGGTEARLALTRAAQLARALDARLRLVAVTPVYGDADDDLLLGAREITVRERLAAGARSISDLELDTACERGDVVKVLSRHGVDLDLLVVGSRGHGRARRTLAGSVASALVRNSPCPVLVTPRGDRGQRATNAT